MSDESIGVSQLFRACARAAPQSLCLWVLEIPWEAHNPALVLQ